MNNENQLPSKYRWNHRTSLTNGNTASAVGKMKKKGTTKSRKYKSLHGVQAFHRRQHLKPINCVSITNRRNSSNNIRRASRVSEKDLVSILEQTLVNKINPKFDFKGTNRTISSVEQSYVNNQTYYRYILQIKTDILIEN